MAALDASHEVSGPVEDEVEAKEKIQAIFKDVSDCMWPCWTVR